MQYKIDELELEVRDLTNKYLGVVALLEKQTKVAKLLAAHLDELHTMVTKEGFFKIEEGIEALKGDLEESLDDKVNR